MRALALVALLLAPVADAAERQRRRKGNLSKPSPTLEGAANEKDLLEKRAEDAAGLPEAGTADADTVQLADIVIKTPTAELDPTLAGAFLKVDTATLPARQRKMARGKQIELRALISVAEGKKRGAIRMIGPTGCTPTKVTPADIPLLVRLGFVETEDWAVAEAGAQTECTEQDMQCQFSLHIVDMPKGSKPPRRYFFQERDPMLAIVQMKERGSTAKQTQFFGVGFLKCQR